MNTTNNTAVNNPELQKAYSEWAAENNNGALNSKDWQLVCLGADFQATKQVASHDLLVDALEAAKKWTDERYTSEKEAADIHNNTDGVGIDFDYASYTKMPEWYEKAKAALQQAKLIKPCK